MLASIIVRLYCNFVRRFCKLGASSKTDHTHYRILFSSQTLLRRTSLQNIAATLEKLSPIDIYKSVKSFSTTVRRLIHFLCHSGDTILAINGHAVFLEMANSIVRAQSGEDELVFIVKKRTHVGSALTSTPAHHHLLTSSRHGNLVRLVSGKETTSSRHHRHSPPLLFLCLTLDTKEEDPADKACFTVFQLVSPKTFLVHALALENVVTEMHLVSQRDLIYDVIEYHMMSCDPVQDILYCYPTEARDWGTASGEGVKSEEVTALLMKLRGVFLTLSDVMSSITADAHSWSVDMVPA